LYFLYSYHLYQIISAQQAFSKIGTWKVTGRESFRVYTNNRMLIDEVDGDAFRNQREVL